MKPAESLDELRRHVAMLACVDETEAPFVSFCLNLEHPIEVVEHCDPLMTLGGVGCLLRYWRRNHLTTMHDEWSATSPDLIAREIPPVATTRQKW
jgi:hypothetical protein